MIGVVTGLAFEARDLRVGWGGPPPPVRTGLGEAAADAARALVEAGATVLVSFGLGGGLESGLAPGTVVVAATLVGDERTWRSPARGGLARELGGRCGGLYTAPRPLLDPAAKAAAAGRTGAVVVDLESAHVAAVAAAAGRAVLAVRVVADPAERALPRLAATAARRDGTLDPRATLAALLRYPADWPLVAASARDTARARRGLRRAAAGLAGLTRQGLLERFLDVAVEDVGGGSLVR